jgi:membrane-associated protease RseP (regulator of RpoE activity)
LKDVYEVTSTIDQEITENVKKGFLIKDVREDEGLFIVEPRFTHKASFDLILNELLNHDLYPLYRQEGEDLTLRIVKKKGKKRGLKPFLHGLLLVATIFTVTVAGFIWWAGGDLGKSLFFTLGLMGILGGHELGHAIVARKNRVDATLPFFLPVPPFFAFGTLGAVIFMNSPIPDRKSLFDIGIAGPITGFILSLPVLIIGISLSEYVPFDPTHADIPFLLGAPILFDFLTNIILGTPPPDFIPLAHPIAIAGWAGIFVTALNLLPMGQLDGGHVVRSVFPRKFKVVYKWVFRILFVMGGLGVLSQTLGPEWLVQATWPGWIVWAVLVFFMTRLDHPGPLNDVSPLDGKRKIASIILLIIFIVSFTPVPIISL